MTDDLAQRFEEHRGRLRAIAYRILASPNEADDAVQEAWLRFSRSNTAGVDDLGSWLTTVVSRVCLNMLQARKSRPQPPADADMPEPAGVSDEVDPEYQALLSDSVGLALLVVLDTLTPAERVAFVLHDIFAIPFDEIARILGRSPPAARQLASRARARVQERDSAGETDPARQAELVDAFLGAARTGDFDALLALLDPDVVLRADEHAVALGAAAESRGAEQVAEFSRYARGGRRAVLDGAAALVWMPGGRPRVVWAFTTTRHGITAIELIADPARFPELDLVIAADA
ncbi:MAG TPA: sigma-70 family RNA polymerase sigma factor [Gaiellaceae bacterium]|nr:sigma-70 family RNA polymerase sigma factor [Gaiellaceae bacterium]